MNASQMWIPRSIDVRTAIAMLTNWPDYELLMCGIFASTRNRSNCIRSSWEYMFAQRMELSPSHWAHDVLCIIYWHSLFQFESNILQLYGILNNVVTKIIAPLMPNSYQYQLSHQLPHQLQPIFFCFLLVKSQLNRLKHRIWWAVCFVVNKIVLNSCINGFFTPEMQEYTEPMLIFVAFWLLGLPSAESQLLPLKNLSSHYFLK